MTDPEREAKAEEITRALRSALPAEPLRELAILLHRAATILRTAEAQPEPDRRRFRLSEGGRHPRREHDTPRAHRVHW